jgi:hypothetical protein
VPVAPVDSLRIDFELQRLDDVAAWGTPESGLSLSWFGLTDGWYDLVIADHQLFCTRDGDARGVDYYVVRLWEDLIELAPAALEEIPDPLAERVRDVDRWNEWVERTLEVEDFDLWKAGLSWWNERDVYTGYLRSAPRLWFWRLHDELHVRWRSAPRTAESPDWSSPKGDATIKIAAFRDELVRFDRALIAAMSSRIDAIAAGWTRHEVAIDLGELRREQQDRAGWLARALTAARPKLYSWDDVLSAVSALERRIGSALD